MKLTRRHLLAALAAMPVAGGLGAAGAAWRWWERPAGEGLKALSASEADFVDALAEAWMPPGGDPPISGREARVAQFFDDVVAGMAPGSGSELRLLLRILDDLAVPFAGAPFRTLGLDARVALLGRWLHHDQWLLRNAVQAVVVLCGTGYTTHPEVAPVLQPWFACGYGR